MEAPATEICLLAIDWWPMCMTKAEWSGWVQAIGSIAAIAAAAYGIYWQVKRQHALQAIREVEAELKQVRDLQTFLVFADSYLGRLSGAAMFDDTYRTYMGEGDHSVDFTAVSEVFQETHSRDIPGPLLKLGFKHCANAFKRATTRASAAQAKWATDGRLVNGPDHLLFAESRKVFLFNAEVFRERIKELEAELTKLVGG